MIREKVKTRKGLVEQLRAVRDKINIDIQDMTLEEENAYLKKMQEAQDSLQQTLK